MIEPGMARQSQGLAGTVDGNVIASRQPGETDLWRFRVRPPGRRFGWRGVVYASDRVSGVLEVADAAFAAALRARMTRDTIEELLG